MITDVVVIGAGLAGLSTAYHLAESGIRRMVVLEQEKKIGGHASGRNAGMIRQPVEDPVLAILARQGRDSLERAERLGWDIRFRSNGSLFLSAGNSPSEIDKLKKVSDRAGIQTRFIRPSEVSAIHPVLKACSFKKALYCPNDALVDIGLLLGGFLKALKAAEVPMQFGVSLKSIRKIEGSFKIETSNKTILTKKIVNAAGAWAGLVGQIAGASKVPLKAYRRHLFFTKQYVSDNTELWPFVWDLGLGFYFRPMSGKLLLSPCDHTRERVTPANEALSREEKIDPRMQKILIQKARHFSPYFSKLEVSGAQSGLRTMAPDGRFIVGEDPKLRGFFWCAGLGGHGVTTCFSVGRLTGDLVSGQSTDKVLARALSPARFSRKNK